jgi:hypothetical protein
MADPLSVSGLALGAAQNSFQFYQNVANLLDAIRREQQDSVIVLSFRPLQAQRIENLQREIIELTREKQELERAAADSATRKALDKELDVKLHVYGIYIHTMSSSVY